MGGVNLEHLEAARFYLFGDVKFLHFLILLMVLDILSGLVKAWKEKNLWSRKSMFGFARKVMVFIVIILANVVDQILGLSGAVTYGAVIFYIVNEGLSIIENLAKIGVLVPENLAEKLKSIDRNKDSVTEEVRKEFSTKEEDDNSGKDS